MIKRLYIDNFKCFVNFEMKFDSINLLLGANGAGKSSVFEVLNKIQTFIRSGKKVDEIFTINNITKWQRHQVQSFELEIEENGGLYKYELAIEYQMKDYSMRLKYERLCLNNNPLIKFESNTIQFYGDDHSEGKSVPFNNSQSVIALFSDSVVNTIWFKKYIEQKLIVVKVDPAKTFQITYQEEKYLSTNADNFTSWYRHISQDQGKAIEIINHLRETLDGFNSFRFIEAGESHRILKAIFSDMSDNKRPIEYRFDELSDGQRVLIILYTLIHTTKGEGYTLCIDEPENFLALPEIQPWLVELYDYCNTGDLQALLISHHPELINYLAVSSGYWLDREINGPVRIKRIAEDESGLPISELVARGWLYE